MLESKSSLSKLISPVTPPTSACSSTDISGFHLPPVTTQIYPYTNFARNDINFRARMGGKRVTQAGVLGAFFWFALGTFISVLLVFIATQTFEWEFSNKSSKGFVCLPTGSRGGESLVTLGTTDPGLRVSQLEENELCITPECMKGAARIIHRMNQNVDPCDDFYQFSCGLFIAHNEIPDDSFQRSTLQEMQESILVDIKSEYI